MGARLDPFADPVMIGGRLRARPNRLLFEENIGSAAENEAARTL